MKFKFKTIVFYIVFLFINIFFSEKLKADVTPILLYGNDEIFTSPLSFEYYLDYNNSATINEIVTGVYEGDFKQNIDLTKIDKEIPIWVRVKIFAPNQDFFTVELSNIQYRVTHYYQNVADEYVSEKSGFSVSINEKNLKTSIPVFLIFPNTTRRYHYFKVERYNNGKFYLHFRPLKVHMALSQNNDFIYGLLLGCCILISFYLITMFLRLELRIYLFFFFYVFSYGFYVSTLKLHIFNFIWFLNIRGEEIFLIYHVPTAIMIVSLLCIANELIDKNAFKNAFPKIVFNALIVFRLLILFIGIIYKGFLIRIEIDLIFLVFMLIFSLYLAFTKKNVSFLITSSLIFSILFSFLIQYMSAIAERYIYFGFSSTDISLFFSIIGLLIMGLIISQLIKNMQNDINLAQAMRLQDLMEKERLKDKVNKELEDLVHQRTEEIKRRSHELDTFIYKTSHDIRGPLKSIIGVADLTNYSIINQENYVEYFKHIKKSALRLDNTISDLLNVVKANHLKIQKRKIDFNKLIEEVCENLRFIPGFLQVQINKKIYLDLSFKGDYRALYSIFQNMIENAVLYRDKSKEKSFIDIKIFPYGDCIKIIFTDNGIGIPEEQQQQLFEMFYQANPDSRGAGLGLYIIKLLTEQMDGFVELRSKEGEGTSFILTFKSEYP